MTAIHPDLSPASIAPTSQSAARRRLQDLVRADAIVCAVSGFTLLAATDAISELAGVATTGPGAPSARSWWCSAWDWRGWDQPVMTPDSVGSRSARPATSRGPWRRSHSRSLPTCLGRDGR